jgi:hypothetical protein
VNTDDPMNMAREAVFTKDDWVCCACKKRSPVRLAVHTFSEEVECRQRPIVEHFVIMSPFCWRRLSVRHGRAQYVAF